MLASKHCEDSVLVWDCILSSGTSRLVFIDDIMDKNKYLNISKDYQVLLKWALNTVLNFIRIMILSTRPE